MAYSQTLLGEIALIVRNSDTLCDVYLTLTQVSEALKGRQWETLGTALQLLRDQVNLNQRQLAIVLNWVGYSFAQRRLWADALKWYELSHQADQTYAIVLHDQSNVLLVLGNFDEALEAFREATVLEQNVHPEKTKEALPLDTKSQAQRQTQFIGRREELLKFEAALNENRTGNTILVVGQGVIGKTRLLQEIIRMQDSGQTPEQAVSGVVDLYHSEFSWTDRETLTRAISRALEQTVLDLPNAKSSPALSESQSDEGQTPEQAVRGVAGLHNAESSLSLSESQSVEKPRKRMPLESHPVEKSRKRRNMRRR